MKARSDLGVNNGSGHGYRHTASHGPGSSIGVFPDDPVVPSLLKSGECLNPCPNHSFCRCQRKCCTPRRERGQNHQRRKDLKGCGGSADRQIRSHAKSSKGLKAGCKTMNRYPENLYLRHDM